MGSSPRSLRRGISLALALVVMACAPIYEGSNYLVSAPDRPLPAGAMGRFHDFGVELRLQGLKIWIEAPDAVWVPPQGISASRVDPLSLMVLLSFDPGAASYAFDPMGVAVRTEDGRRLSPTGYVGPGRLYNGADRVDAPRKCDVLDTPRLERPGRHAIVRKGCFVLAYDTSVTDFFDLELGGLGAVVPNASPPIEAPLESPPIRFHRRVVKVGGSATMRPLVPDFP